MLKEAAVPVSEIITSVSGYVIPFHVLVRRFSVGAPTAQSISSIVMLLFKNLSIPLFCRCHSKRIEIVCSSFIVYIYDDPVHAR